MSIGIAKYRYHYGIGFDISMKNIQMVYSPSLHSNNCSGVKAELFATFQNARSPDGSRCKRGLPVQFATNTGMRWTGRHLLVNMAWK